jgi:hypothetical protein
VTMIKGTFRSMISLFSLLLVLLAIPKMANAYVDPGSGAMLWQVAAATAIGCLFYVKRILAWIKDHYGLLFGGKPASGSLNRENIRQSPGDLSSAPKTVGNVIGLRQADSIEGDIVKT